MNPTIGFIGLGIMGKPMAKNLIKAGYKLVVYNRSQASMNDLVTCGASAAKSPKELAQQVDVVITMLPDSKDVELVVLGKDGVLSGARAGVIIIDMSSIAPLVTKQIAAAAEKKGVAMLDAPVSGGEPGAIEGTLAIMVGGRKEIFDRCLEILKVMGRSVIHVGDIGAGGFAKLANQIIVALNIAAISEAFVLAKKAQIDPETLLQAIQSGLAGSNVMNAKLPKIMDGDFKPGFKIRLHYKDIKNVMNTARDLNIPLPLTSIVQQILATLIVDEKGELDHAAIVNFEEKLAHVEVRR